MEARGTLGVQMQNPAHFAKIPRLFQNGNQRNLSVSEKLKRPDTHLTKILRSFGCCPLRNLGNFSEGQRLKRAPVGGALKASLRGPS
jgi:hypothetical protein